MSQRAESLAQTFEQTNQGVIDMVEASDDLSVACPAEGWTAAAVGDHVGGSHFGIVEYLLKPIIAGQEIQPLDLDSFNERNAKAAAENAAMPKDEVLKLLREHGQTAATYLRSLSDEELDRTTSMPAFGPDPVTAQQVIEMVLIGHPLDHGQSLGRGLGQVDHEHSMQAAPA